MPNALVIGGTGYIGSRLALALTSKGWRVGVLSRKPGDSDLINELRAAGITILTGDVTDAASLEGITEGVDAVFHLASINGGHPHIIEDVNVEGTRNIASECEGSGAKLVYVGTTAVYGDLPGTTTDEQTPPMPNTLYSKTRATAEGIVLNTGRTGSMGIVVRLGTVYGPYSPVLRDFIVKDGNVRIIGNGRNIANVIHVDDAVSAVILAGEKGEGGRTYIATDGTPITPREFYGEMAVLLGQGKPRFVGTAKLRFFASIFASLGKVTGVPPVITPDTIKLLTNSVSADSSRIRRELGFDPAFPDYRRGLEDSFQKMGK